MELSKAIRTRSLDEQLPKGTNVREHVLRIVYQELVRLVWTSADIKLEPQVILMAGLQGSGKTTTTAKIARYFQKKGMKSGVICADTFRPVRMSSSPRSVQRSTSPVLATQRRKMLSLSPVKVSGA